jgi:hypothetical protein
MVRKRAPSLEPLDNRRATHHRGTRSAAQVQVLWNGPDMVIEVAYGESVLRDYRSLSEDLRTLTIAHRDDILAGQITVLEHPNNM